MRKDVSHRTVENVRFYVAFSTLAGYRIIDQDDGFATWIDGMTCGAACDLCQTLNNSEGCDCTEPIIVNLPKTRPENWTGELRPFVWHEPTFLDEPKVHNCRCAMLPIGYDSPEQKRQAHEQKMVEGYRRVLEAIREQERQAREASAMAKFKSSIEALWYAIGEALCDLKPRDFALIALTAVLLMLILASTGLLSDADLYSLSHGGRQ